MIAITISSFSSHWTALLDWADLGDLGHRKWEGDTVLILIPFGAPGWAGVFSLAILFLGLDRVRDTIAGAVLNLHLLGDNGVFLRERQELNQYS